MNALADPLTHSAVNAAFRAMGTRVAVTTDHDDGLERVSVLFERIEQACSRFRPTSDLSQLNASPDRTTTVPADLAEALRVAIDIAGRTDWLVDPRMGHHVNAWGYNRTFAEVGDLSHEPDIDRPRGELTVDGNLVTRDVGIHIDLGGTAKGWAVDRAIEAGLARVVNAGGDVRSIDDRTEVLVDDPWGGTAANVQLGVGALATSSTAYRSWQVAGRRVSHLIDPRTGRPAQSPVVSATALARTAVEADAAAKTVLLLGTEGLDWALQTPWVQGALVVWHDGSVFATPNLERRLS